MSQKWLATGEGEQQPFNEIHGAELLESLVPLGMLFSEVYDRVLREEIAQADRFPEINDDYLLKKFFGGPSPSSPSKGLRNSHERKLRAIASSIRAMPLQAADALLDHLASEIAAECKRLSVRPKANKSKSDGGMNAELRQFDDEMNAELEVFFKEKLLATHHGESA